MNLLRCSILDIETPDLKTIRKTINLIFNNPYLIYEIKFDDMEKGYLFKGKGFLKNLNKIKFSNLESYFYFPLYYKFGYESLEYKEFIYKLFYTICNIDKLYSNLNTNSKVNQTIKLDISEEIDYIFYEENENEVEIINIISGNFANGNIIQTIFFNDEKIESEFTNFQAFHICKGIKNLHSLYNKYINNKYTDEDIFYAHKNSMEALKKYGKDIISFVLSLPEQPFRSDNFKLLFNVLDKRKNEIDNPVYKLNIKNENNQQEEIEFSFFERDSTRFTNKIKIRNSTRNYDIADVSKDGKIIPKEKIGTHKNITPVLQFLYSITKNEESLKSAILSYGVESGNCVICNKKLTDPMSKIKGIGPICEQKL